MGKINNKMINYKITVQYDGTRYRGWQSLKDRNDTIQGKIKEVLHKLSGEEIDVIGSGRTDAGVHAIGQVANFHMEELEGFTDEKLLDYMNHYLPMDIAITSLERVPERFHARHSARQKIYRYRIHTSKIKNVFERKYVYSFANESLDIENMKKAAGLLMGTHDFKAFCSNKRMNKSTVRTIYDIDIKPIYSENGESIDEIEIFYTGNGFMHNMVRILTGTLIDVGRGYKSYDSMQEILEYRDRKMAGFTAPAEGLTLMEVIY